MNAFDRVFFKKYLHEGEDLIEICHRHFVLILDDICVWILLWVAIPVFFYYYNSFQLQAIVPMHYFEVYLILIYCYLGYRIFDWYNDVWMITTKGLVDLDWRLFTSNVFYIEFGDIRWVEIREHHFYDWLIGKGDIVLHLASQGSQFVLEDALHPSSIHGHIQEALDLASERLKEKEAIEKEQAKAPFEKLLDTLTNIVREHMDGSSGSPERVMPFSDDAPELKKVLEKKGTIDLRSRWEDVAEV